MNQISITQTINTMANDLARRFPELSAEVEAVRDGVASFDDNLQRVSKLNTAYGLVQNWEAIAAPAVPAIERVAKKAQQEEDAALIGENNAAVLMPNPTGAGFVQLNPLRTRTAEELSHEQWIWSEIRRMPSKEAIAMYFDAIQRRDLVLTQIFERMPPAFSPLASADPKNIKALKYASLLPEHRASIEQRRERAQALRMIESKAKQLIGERFKALQLA